MIKVVSDDIFYHAYKWRPNAGKKKNWISCLLKHYNNKFNIFDVNYKLPTKQMFS